MRVGVGGKAFFFCLAALCLQPTAGWGLSGWFSLFFFFAFSIFFPKDEPERKPERREIESERKEPQEVKPM